MKKYKWRRMSITLAVILLFACSLLEALPLESLRSRFDQGGSQAGAIESGREVPRPGRTRCSGMQVKYGKVATYGTWNADGSCSGNEETLCKSSGGGGSRLPV
jgi:hypothetical protein